MPNLRDDAIVAVKGLAVGLTTAVLAWLIFGTMPG